MNFQTVVNALQQGIIKYEPDDVSPFQCNNDFNCKDCPINLFKIVNSSACAIYDQQALVNPYIPQLKHKYPEYFI